MKKKMILGGLFIMLMITTILTAQEGDYLEQRVNKLKMELALSGEQMKKMHQIYSESRRQMVEIHELNKDKREALATAFQQNREETDHQIMTLLSPDQQSEYEAYKKKRANNISSLILQQKLGLTDEQTLQIQPILMDGNAKLRQLKNEGGRRFQKARKAKKIMDEQDRKIEALLSEEQKELYKDFKKQRKERMKALKNK